jgi:hypothetical protein
VTLAGRSLETISAPDLSRLEDLARRDRRRMFEVNPRWEAYRERVLCVCLCQGAALHLLDGVNGIKDFDVWTFFSRSRSRPFPDPSLHRRRAVADFGPSRFGRTPGAPRRLQGRRVDLLARALDVPPDADPVEAVRAWLRRGRETSARRLAEKAVVMIEPGAGTVVWPP